MNALSTQAHCTLCAIGDWFKRLRKAMELAPYIDDLYEAFEERERDGKLTRTERELLENTLTFGDITADDVSIPRADIMSVGEKSDLKKVIKAFRESAHSRLPVIGKDLDDIKGILLLKEVLPLLDKPEDFDIKSLMRPVAFVQESMPLPRVLQVMKKSRLPLVLVTDEFGGTSGLITLKDVVEELVGDLDDEPNQGDAAPFVAIGPNRYRVRGDCPLRTFDAAAGTRLSDHYGTFVETVGGAIMQASKTVPAKGERFSLDDGVEGIVVASDGRRVLAIDIKIVG